MRKGLLLIFILMNSSWLLANAAPGEPKQGFDFEGQVRLRGELTDNTGFTTASDSMNFLGTRIRLNAAFHAAKFFAMIQPQYSKSFGMPNSFGAPASGVLTDGVLFLHQGYAQIMWNEFSLWGGRKEVAYGDHLVIGNVGWSNIGRSFDGITGRWTIKDLGWIDFLFLSRVEGSSLGLTAFDDYYLLGAYSSWVFWFFDAIDFYFLVDANYVSSAVGADNNRFVLGTRMKSNSGDFYYRAEVTGQLISRHHTTGLQEAFQADLEVGFAREIWRLAMELAFASINYRQLYPTAHKWLGHQDLFSRRNIIDLVLHAWLKTFNALNLFIDIHQFFRPNTSNPAFMFGGASYGTAGGSGWIGLEVDTYAKLKVHDFLMLQLGFSLLFPQAYLKANVGSEIPIFMYLQGTSNF